MKIPKMRFSSRTIAMGLILLGVLLILLPIITAALGMDPIGGPKDPPCDTLLGCGLPYD